MRTSGYNIYIDVDGTGKYLLIHGYTGAIDVVDQSIVDMLRGEKFATMSKETMDVLLTRGYITNQSEVEEQNRIVTLAEMIHERDPKSYDFMFFVAYECNFRCAYCYEADRSASGTSRGGELFSKEMVDHAYAAIDAMADSSKGGSKIMLYGGEPLLKKNAWIVDYIIRKGLRRGHRFGAITNGYELEAFKKYLSPDRLSFLEITIDGCKVDHNERRRHFLEGDTYDKIMGNIGLALEHGVRVDVRLNVERSHMSCIDEFTDEVIKRGWQTKENFSCYASPVPPMRLRENGGSMTCSSEPDIDSSDNAQMLELAAYIAKYLLACRNTVVRMRNNPIRENMESGLANGGFLQMRSAFCEAHQGGIIFDPKGRIYSNWESIGHDFTAIGTFSPSLQMDEDQKKRWNNKTLFHLHQCVKCKYAFHCGGGCSARALAPKGTLCRSFCDGFPTFFSRNAQSAYQEFLAHRK